MRFQLTKEENLYGRKAVKIPIPYFVIFYNGEEELPDRVILSLSDLYKIPAKYQDSLECDSLYPALELKAVLLNINPGHNQELLDSCKTLRDYSEYTARVRRYAKQMNLEDAVERANTECIEEGIRAFIADHIEEGIPREKSITKLQNLFSLTSEEAEMYYKKYSQH